MTVAKIFRHRHVKHHYINDTLKSVTEDVHFKIIFSAPVEMKKFEDWCIDNDGKYNYDKENSEQLGKMPELEEFKGQDICWCDLMTFYLLHVAGYKFHSSISPYKAEIYVKE